MWITAKSFGEKELNMKKKVDVFFEKFNEMMDHYLYGTMIMCAFIWALLIIASSK